MDKESRLHILKRKRTRERSTATRFMTAINEFNDTTSLDDCQHYKDRLQDTLDKLVSLDDSIQDLLTDTEFDADVEKCEEYIDSAKRALRLVSRHIDNRLAASTSAVNINNHPIAPPTPVTHSFKLPTIKLEPFAGNIEEWSRFWEQFESSVDKNPSVSSIDKHVFLRGYLDGEPKRLVDGIAVTAENYGETKRILQSKYGDKNRIIQTHLDFLENLKPISSITPESLNYTYVECNRRLQALRALGENIENYGRILAPKILRAFPEDICRRWIIYAKREGLSEGNITRLMEFLNEEVEGSLSAQKIRGDSLSTDYLLPTTAAFHVNTRSRNHTKGRRGNPEPFCVFCEGRGHWAQDCKLVVEVKDRIQKLQGSSRCFLCLKQGHSVKNCSKRGKALCSKCKKPHHYSICTSENLISTSVNKIDTQSPDYTHLQTARIRLVGPTGLSKETRCVLDGGSQSSFISESLITTLKLEVLAERHVSITAFETDRLPTEKRRLVRLQVQGLWNRSKQDITALESHNNYSTHPPISQNVSLPPTAQKIQLADPKDDQPDLPIELLIGGDHYWKIIKDTTPIRISPSLVLLPSIFGWILSGSRSGVSVNQISVNKIELQREFTLLDTQVRQFWDLESMGIKDTEPRTLSTTNAHILRQFHESFRMEDGRRVVSLPKNGEPLLDDNRTNAENRFQALTRRLRNNPDYDTMYQSKMLDYIVKGQVEVIDTEPETDSSFYLPHHAVKKEKRGMTKWRIVFDASSHGHGSSSLNDILGMGPNLLPEPLTVLLRFRTYSKAVVCDGHQAFLQLALDEDDRNLTRFLWYRMEQDDEGNYKPTNDVISYRFTRLPFGLTSSPFLLSATLRELATLYHERYPLASAVLDKSTYMDDFTASVEDDNNAISLYYELTALLRKIKLPLSQWASNAEPLKDIWKIEGQEIKPETSVLGVEWNTEGDHLFTDQHGITTTLLGKPATKRKVLSATAKFYDPLGLFAPVLIIAKILFQDIWLRGIDWEEILPAELATRWQSWTSKLQDLSRIHIPRWLGISSNQSIEIHVFCDASERAYGAVLYVRSTLNTNSVVRLACSKTRLAPIKKVTLPRLELLAALLGARLLHYFCQATDIEIAKAILWSDSSVTLGWIRNDPNKWKTFVCNRVTEVLKYTTPSQWRHCPGTENPADHLTRGIEVDDIHSLDHWMNGPQWLAEDRASWPRDIYDLDTTLPEARIKSPQVLTIIMSEPLLDVERFSSYWKLLHVTAWIFRFIKATREKVRFPHPLTAADLEAARNYWIHKVQEQCFTVELSTLCKGDVLPTTSKIARFNPFLDNTLIRLGGRLHFSELLPEQRHPLLLDGSHHFVHLLIHQTHIKLHHLGVRIVLSELRSEFWVLRARQAVKKVLRNCLPCKLAHSRFCQAIEAPLPVDRVKPLQPFEVTGIDFAGPLYVKVGSTTRKCYIALFTCASTRVLHLELCSDMTTHTFLLALHRFAGRRGDLH